MALIEDRRTHETDDGGQALIPEARELQRRRRWRRGSGGLLAAALLAGGCIVLANGGGGGGSHASVASVGVHGALPAGIAARAADPAGGPPWGIRIVHTTGYTCVQLGGSAAASSGCSAATAWPVTTDASTQWDPVRPTKRGALPMTAAVTPT
jgi:hypothetical protein